jgi:methylphosphotriester-DNA--protein-cysteine methyltransferase
MKTCTLNNWTIRTALTSFHSPNSVSCSDPKRLLARSGLNISEIASELGFGDACYFTRLFRRIEKMQPSRAQRDLSVRRHLNRLQSAQSSYAICAIDGLGSKRPERSLERFSESINIQRVDPVLFRKHSTH